MKLLISLLACHCIFSVGIKGFIDISVGLTEMRSVLGIAANVQLVQIVNSSDVTLSSPTNEMYSNPNIVIRFELRANSVPVYDAGVTAEFFTNGSYAGSWTSRGAEIVVHDNGVPHVSSRRALYILAKKFNLCPQIKQFQRNDISLLYLMDPNTKHGRLIYRASVVLYGSVTSLGNDTTETIQPTALIDANTGEVIQSWNGLTTQSVTATTIKAYGGNNGTVLGQLTYEALAVGRLTDELCIYSTPDVQIQDMASATNILFAPSSFKCKDPSSTTYDNTNGGYSPLNDAMRNAQTTVDMYRKYTKLNGPQNVVPVKLRVHYGVNCDNAFWDTTYVNICDGTPTTNFPWVTLDIVAHELGHAFTGSNNGSRLEFVSQSGGISEAFSDMSGQAAIFFVTGRTPSLTIGAEVTKSGKPLRDMCNPTADGLSIDHYSAYKEGMNPHYSSGLFNKAFCLLVRIGGKWTVDNTFQMFAEANKLHWRPKSSFSEGVCGVQNTTLYYLGSIALDDVRKAFLQVGLQC